MMYRTLATILCLIGTAAFAADNTICPISGRAVKPGVTSDMEGTTVAFCCGGCKSKFNAMSPTDQQAKFASLGGGADSKAKQSPAATNVDPDLALAQVYLLGTCPVSSKGVNSMDDPASKVIDGREVMVCCPPCFGTIDKNAAKFNAKIDKKVTEQQLAKGTPTNAVYGNRLMRFCCGGCAAFIIKDPVRLKKALQTLDAATIKKQLPTYTMTTCIVSGEPLGDKPVNVVIGGQLVRLCCGGCEKKFRKNPRAFLSKLKPAKTATGSAEG
jgi:YHS domain-containing protein